ncbi:hypothetical protein JCM11251_006411 [Rhodosporidiobolus azoricus]
MASSVASTSTLQAPPLSVAPSLVFGRPPAASTTSSSTAINADPNLPRSVVLDNATETSGGRLKKFMCTWPGCGKCYTRPARLEEHQRVHTGERPFACTQCTSTFARDSHLKAHMRTHSSQKEKRYPCKEEGCDKKFWTNQHLKKHVEVVHKGKTYDCPSCDESFRKHHQLRTHIAEQHSAPGTDPFQCEHPGCGRSFKQKVHLKAHEKTHDPTRYVCLHPDCASLPLSDRQFSTWTLLQRHTKTAHPPTCPHSECRGKTFTTNRGLRNHLALHEGDAKGDDGEDGGVTTTDAEGEGGRTKKTKQKRRSRGRKRRMGQEEDEDEEGEKAEKPPAKKRKRTVKVKEVYENEADEDGEGDGEVEDEDEEEAEFTAEETAEEDEWNEEGSEWEEEQERSRDERMREDFRYGGKKKRKVLAEADGFPALAFPPLPPFPLPPPPDPTFSASSSDERGGHFSLPDPPAYFNSTPLLAPAEAPAPSPAKKSAFFDLVTGANYAQPVASTSASPSAAGSPTKRTLRTPKREARYVERDPEESDVNPLEAEDGAAEEDANTAKYQHPTKYQPHTATFTSGPISGRASAILPRKYPCPFPAILGLPFKDVGPGHLPPGEKGEAGEEGADDSDTEGMCGFWFKRVYDVERHLRARHGVEVTGGRKVLEGWFKEEEE